MSKAAGNALIVLGMLVLAFTAIATMSEIQSGIITRRPFSESSGIVANRAVDPGEFWTQITRRVVGVGAIGGAVIVLGLYFRRLHTRGSQPGQSQTAVTKPEILRCSFCQKDQSDVQKLIAGPTVFICDECVEICNDILADDPQFSTPQGQPPASPAVDAAVPRAASIGLHINCALCRTPIVLEEGLAVEYRGFLCPGCVGAIEAALAERAE